MIALNQNGTGFISWNTGGSDLGGDIQFSFYDKKNRNFSQIFTVSGSTFANSSPTVNTKNMGVIAFNSGADKGGGIYYILLNPLSSLIQNSQGRIFLQRGYPL